MRAAVDLGTERERVVEHAGDAFYDREAEPDAAGNVGCLVETMELGEYGAALVRWNADAGIVDIDPQRPAATPAPDQDAARHSVFDRVGDEILQEPAQKAPIRPYAERTGHESEVKTLAAGERREIGLDAEKQLVDPEARDL